VIGGQPPATPPPSAMISFPSLQVPIVSDFDGYCLDVPNDDASNGVDLILGACDSTTSQSWLLNFSDGSIRTSLNSNKCIGVEGAIFSNGTPIEIQDCISGNNVQQQWTFGADGTVQSVSNPSYCFDGNGLNEAVYLWNCDGTSDQYFSIPVYTTIVSDNTGYCLDIPNDDTTNGVDVILGICDSTSSQSWVLNNDGSIRSSLDSSKCLEVQGSLFSNGSPIEVQDCSSGNAAQKWMLGVDGTIQPVGNTSFCVDENGLNEFVYLWTCDGSNDQYFTMGGLAL